MHPWIAAADSEKGCLSLWNIGPKPCVLFTALYDDWDAQCGIEKGFLGSGAGPTIAIAFIDADAAAAQHRAALLSLSTRSFISSLSGSADGSSHRQQFSLTPFNPCGAHVMVSTENRLYLYSYNTGKVISIGLPDGKIVNCIEPVLGGDSVALGCSDGILRLLSLTDLKICERRGDPKQPQHPKAICFVSCTIDRQGMPHLLSVSVDGSLALWPADRMISKSPSGATQHRLALPKATGGQSVISCHMGSDEGLLAIMSSQQVAFFSVDTLAEVPSKKIRAPKDVKFSDMCPLMNADIFSGLYAAIVNGSILAIIGPNDAYKSLGDIKIQDKDKKDKKRVLKLNSICTHFSRCDMLVCGTSNGLVVLQLSESKFPRTPPAVVMLGGTSSALCFFIMNKSLHMASAAVPAPARKMHKEDQESNSNVPHPFQLHLLAPPPLVCKTFKLSNEFSSYAGCVMNLAYNDKYLSVVSTQDSTFKIFKTARSKSLPFDECDNGTGCCVAWHNSSETFAVANGKSVVVKSASGSSCNEHANFSVSTDVVSIWGGPAILVCTDKAAQWFDWSGSPIHSTNRPCRSCVWDSSGTFAAISFTDHMIILQRNQRNLTELKRFNTTSFSACWFKEILFYDDGSRIFMWSCRASSLPPVVISSALHSHLVCLRPPRTLKLSCVAADDDNASLILVDSCNRMHSIPILSPPALACIAASTGSIKMLARSVAVARRDHVALDSCALFIAATGGYNTAVSIPGISTRALLSICTSGRLLSQGQHAACKLIAEMNSHYGVQFLKTVPAERYWNCIAPFVAACMKAGMYNEAVVPCAAAAHICSAASSTACIVVASSSDASAVRSGFRHLLASCTFDVAAVYAIQSVILSNPIDGDGVESMCEDLVSSGGSNAAMVVWGRFRKNLPSPSHWKIGTAPIIKEPQHISFDSATSGSLCEPAVNSFGAMSISAPVIIQAASNAAFDVSAFGDTSSASSVTASFDMSAFAGAHVSSDGFGFGASEGNGFGSSAGFDSSSPAFGADNDNGFRPPPPPRPPPPSFPPTGVSDGFGDSSGFAASADGFGATGDFGAENDNGFRPPPPPRPPPPSFPPTGVSDGFGDSSGFAASADGFGAPASPSLAASSGGFGDSSGFAASADGFGAPASPSLAASSGGFGASGVDGF